MAPRRDLIVLAAVMLAGGCGDDDLAEPPSTTVVTTSSAAETTTTPPSEEPPSSAVSSSVPAEDEVVVESERLSGSTSEGNAWDISYPAVSGTPFEDRINTVLQRAAEGDLADWQAQLGDFPVVEDLPSDLFSDYEVTLLDDATLSILVTSSSYFSGAAHPTADVVAFTFDLATGEQIALTDLFDPAGDWQTSLVEEAKTRLADSYGDLIEVATLDLGADTDFNVFNLTPRGLLVTFTEGEIGPHALGLPSFEIPYAELAPLVAAGGALDR